MTDPGPVLGLLQTLAQPLTDPASRTFAPWLLIGAALALVLYRAPQGQRGWPWLRDALGLRLWLHPTARADLYLLVTRRLLAALGWLPELGGAWFVATRLARWLDATLGSPGWTADPAAIAVGYTVVLFVAWDASRYVVHRLMHAVPALWALHQVHHSAEVLTPLTFHRIHPVESLIYTLRGALVGGVLAGLAWWAFRGAAEPLVLLGVHGIGLVLNAVFGNLRHSHVWLRFGALERWFLSPAQHQLHHSVELAEATSNYGTWLALWDRVGGSWRPAGVAPPTRFGVADGERNHDPADLVSMLVRPLLAAGRAVLPAVLLFAALPAVAQDDEELDDEETMYEVIVEAEDGVPRVAGSAYKVSEEQLERFEYDDIHKILESVPGVYLRGEDGFGLRPNIGMRGGNADRSQRVALLEDGVPMAPAPYAAPAAYYFPMATRMVGVEVFKGPAAIRHGPQTVGGAVNLLTRGVPTEGADGAVDVALGLRKTVSGHGWVGTGNERLGLLIEASHLSSNGFKTLDTEGPTNFDRQDVMAKLRWATPRTQTAGQSLELKLGYGHEQSWETYLGLSVDDFAKDPYRRYAASDGDRMRWHRQQAELAWQARVGRHLDVRTVAYYHHLHRRWFKLNGFVGGTDLHDLLQLSDPRGTEGVLLAILRGEEDSFSSDQNLLRGTNDREFHSGGLQTTARLHHGGNRVYNELEVGLRLHADHVVKIHSQAPWAMVDEVMERRGREKPFLEHVLAARALALHAHDTLDIGRFEWVPGVRVEVVNTLAGELDSGLADPQTRTMVLPGTGFLVQAADWLDVFGGLHRGFSPVPPGAGEEQLPESAWSYELGLRAASGETHAEAVGFFSDYDRINGQCTVSSGCDQDLLDTQFDGGRARIAGVESLVAHTWRLPGRLALSPEATYTLTEARFVTAFDSEFPQFGEVEPGDVLPYVPEHQGSAQLALDHQRFSLAVSGHGRSGMRDEAGQGEVPAEIAIPGIVTMDAAAKVSLVERCDLYVTGTNLTNVAAVESWRPFGARPIAPRQLMLGVKGRL